MSIFTEQIRNKIKERLTRESSYSFESGYRTDALSENNFSGDVQLRRDLWSCQFDEFSTPCNNPACAQCNLLYRYERIERAVDFIEKHPCHDWKLLTIEDGCRAVTSTKLMELGPYQLRDRALTPFYFLDFPAPIIGSIEINYDSLHRTWIPMYKLLLPINEYIEGCIRRYSDRNFTNRYSRYPLISKSLSKTPYLIEKLFPLSWGEYKTYIPLDGTKQKLHRVHLEGKKLSIMLHFMKKAGFSGLSISYGLNYDVSGYALRKQTINKMKAHPLSNLST